MCQGLFGQSFKNSNFVRTEDSLTTGLLISDRCMLKEMSKKEFVDDEWLPDLGDVYHSNSANDDFFLFSINLNKNNKTRRPKIGKINDFEILLNKENFNLRIRDCGVILE